MWRRLQSWLLICIWIEAVDCGRCVFHFENFSVCHTFKRGRSPLFLLSVTHLHDNFSELTHYSCMCHIYCLCVVVFLFYMPKINMKLWVMCIIRVFLVSAEFISWFTYLLTYLFTYSMVQSPSWAANWFAASQEIPCISRNPKVHYHTHKRLPPVSILGQSNSVHIPTSHLLEIHPNIIHPSTPRYPQWSFPSGFPTKTLYTSLFSPIRATCPAHLILLDFITRTMLAEEYKSFSSSLCSLLHSPVTSSLLGPNILPNTLFSKTLSFDLQKTLRRIIIAAIKWKLLTVVFIGKEKTKWGMVNKLCTYSTQVAIYLTELPGVIGQARKATSPFEAWKYLFTDEILDKVVQQTSVYSYRTYFQPRKWRQIHRNIEIKAFVLFPCLAGALRNDRVWKICGIGTGGDGIEKFR